LACCCNGGFTSDLTHIHKISKKALNTLVGIGCFFFKKKTITDRKMLKITIPHSKKEDFLRKLSDKNISKESLFPD